MEKENQILELILDMKNELTKEIGDMRKEFTKEIIDMKKEIVDMKKEIVDMKKDIGTINKEVISIKKDLEVTKKDINSRFDKIEIKLDENSKILRALEHSAEVNKAEHDKMSNDIAHIQGDIKDIKRDMYRVEEATANNWADIAKLKAVK